MYNKVMKVFAVSDLHLSGGVSDKPMDIFGESWQGYMEAVEEDWRARVGEEDVVLLAGDLSWGMHLHEALPDIERVRRLPGIKAIVRGNHDYWWSSIGKVRAALGENFYAVQNDCVRIERLLVCGSRLWQFGQSDEDMKLLAREKQRLALSLQHMRLLRREGDRVVVMCHYPPFNVRYEDNDFTAMIAEAKADAVVYGHLHGKNTRAEIIVRKRGIPYYLTSCDLIGNKLLQILDI